MKKPFVLLLALCAALSLCAPAFAEEASEEIYGTRFAPLYPVVLSPAQAFITNVENCNVIFEEQRTAPTWLFSRLKEQGAGVSMTLTAELYRLTFLSDDVKETLITGPRYHLGLELRSKNLPEHETYFGIRTPKFEITLEATDPLPTEKVLVTLPVGRFLPTSQYHVYKVDGAGAYTLVHEGLTVPDDGSLGFTLTEGGVYLLSAGKLGEHSLTYRAYPTIEELKAGADFPA